LHLDEIGHFRGFADVSENLRIRLRPVTSAPTSEPCRLSNLFSLTASSHLREIGSGERSLSRRADKAEASLRSSAAPALREYRAFLNRARPRLSRDREIRLEAAEADQGLT